MRPRRSKDLQMSMSQQSIPWLQVCRAHPTIPREISLLMCSGSLVVENCALTALNKCRFFWYFLATVTRTQTSTTLCADQSLRSHSNALSQHLHQGQNVDGVHLTSGEHELQDEYLKYGDSTGTWYIAHDPQGNNDNYDDEYDAVSRRFSRPVGLMVHTGTKGTPSKKCTRQWPQRMPLRTWARQCGPSTTTREMCAELKGVLPVSEGAHTMDVSKQGRTSKGSKHKFKAKEGDGKLKRKSSWPCLLYWGAHWARDCPTHHGRKRKRGSIWKGSMGDSMFRQGHLEGDGGVWTTDARTFAVSQLCHFEPGWHAHLGQRSHHVNGWCGCSSNDSRVSLLRFSSANGEEDVNAPALVLLQKEVKPESGKSPAEGHL